MSFEAVRAALFDFHQEEATEAGIRTVYKTWPTSYPTELPALLLRRGAGQAIRRDGFTVKGSFWHPTILYVEADERSRAFAEEQHIAILDALIPAYFALDSYVLLTPGNECEYATILLDGSGEQAGLNYTEVIIEKFLAKEYYQSELTLYVEEWVS